MNTNDLLKAERPRIQNDGQSGQDTEGEEEALKCWDFAIKEPLFLAFC